MLLGALAIAVCLGGCDESVMGPLIPFASRSGDEQFTILLSTFSGFEHAQQANQFLQSAQRMTGWESLHVRHTSEGSQLLWGKHSSIKGAQNDLARAKAFRTASGQSAFATAIIVPIAGGKPVGPSQWDLQGARGSYTVMVAVFYNVSEAGYVGRKKFAVDYCKQLRDKGEQAYYYHGPIRSAVTVGLFGPSAVQKVTEGQKVQAVTRDPQIRRIVERFKYLAVNGRQETVKILNPATGKRESTPQRPRVISVPQKKDTGELDSRYYSGYSQSWKGR